MSIEPSNVNEWCSEMRKALNRRSRKRWSVRHGSGSAYGWIDIRGPGNNDLSPEDRQELAALLGLTVSDVHEQGVSIAAANDYRREYLARCRGATPLERGTPYWD